MSGLILPGESLSHLLIASLLLDNPHASPLFGHDMNLDGGLIYRNRSFWRTRCIVGKILVARKSSLECMGWVSSDVLPRGAPESWIKIEVVSRKESDQVKKARKTRIWPKILLEKHGNVIAGTDSSSVLISDFVLPSDESIFPPIIVQFLFLDMLSTDNSAVLKSGRDTDFLNTNKNETKENKIPNFLSTARFSIEAAGEKKMELSIDLTHDVFFVTAHPCVPPAKCRNIDSPTHQPSKETRNNAVVVTLGSSDIISNIISVANY
ncbi:putative helicase-like protein [Golovinomyces cichoracearum]|uniref:Putative helicase-like protein n=1 Tax=Golovinomyces cichoracearum TaxID=62708 RepID=A0A420I1V0_9PEZI|nr:putative helicase-like protein [Golovinomyces cichoracearum]